MIVMYISSSGLRIRCHGQQFQFVAWVLSDAFGEKDSSNGHTCAHFCPIIVVMTLSMSPYQRLLFLFLESRALDGVDAMQQGFILLSH